MFMSEGSRREREERAADALLVSLLRRVDKDDDYIDPKHLPQLTDEEKAAMEALGSDFVDRLLAGERPLASQNIPTEDCPDEREVALAGGGADRNFNRAEVVDDATTEELGEREREIIERRARERKEGGGEPTS
jgi:hypothetical protein